MVPHVSLNGHLLIRIAMDTLFGPQFVLSQVGPYNITVWDALTLLSPQEAAACGLNVFFPDINPGWLTSKVMDAFLWIIQARHNVAVLETKLTVPENERIKQCTKLLVPLMVNYRHWTLLVFDKNQRTVLFVDPERRLSRNSSPDLDEYIKSLFWRVVQKTGWDSFCWRYCEPDNFPLQEDNYNCGVITCLVALGLVEGRTIEEMNSYPLSEMRKQIAFRLNIMHIMM